MEAILNVYALPTLATPEELAGDAVVIIDVLRASTTITHALAAGAKEVIPCLEVADVRALAAKLPRSQYILAGERGGLPIDGFDLGNTPTDYTTEAVGGKTVIFTTTNGTRAMFHSRLAGRIWIGAFVNVTAVLDRLAGQERIHLVCAGSGGKVTRDDVLFAGLLVDRIERSGGMGRRLNAQAVTAREDWTSSFAVPYAIGAEPLPPGLLAEQLRKSMAGQRLTSIGLAADVLTASRIDRFSIVPEFDPQTGRISTT